MWRSSWSDRTAKWKSGILTERRAATGAPLKNKPKPLRAFATHEEQSKVIREMRLLRDDLSELSDYLGILIALSKRADDKKLIDYLNGNAEFWNLTLSSLESSAFVVLGRILDSRKESYLKALVRFMERSARTGELAKKFEELQKRHADLIERVIRLRNNVFAHTGHTMPEHVAFGFRDITWEKFEAFWRDLAEVAELLEELVFGGEKYGPNIASLDENIARADVTLNQLKKANQSRWRGCLCSWLLSG